MVTFYPLLLHPKSRAMSIHSIKQYHLELEQTIQFGGTRKETSVRVAFFNLLNEYAKQQGLRWYPR